MESILDFLSEKGAKMTGLEILDSIDMDAIRKATFAQFKIYDV